MQPARALAGKFAASTDSRRKGKSALDRDRTIV
jgi:hypothetical protein